MSEGFDFFMMDDAEPAAPKSLSSKAAKATVTRTPATRMKAEGRMRPMASGASFQDAMKIAVDSVSEDGEKMVTAKAAEIFLDKYTEPSKEWRDEYIEKIQEAQGREKARLFAQYYKSHHQRYIGKTPWGTGPMAEYHAAMDKLLTPKAEENQMASLAASSMKLRQSRTQKDAGVLQGVQKSASLQQKSSSSSSSGSRGGRLSGSRTASSAPQRSAVRQRQDEGTVEWAMGGTLFGNTKTGMGYEVDDGIELSVSPTPVKTEEYYDYVNEAKALGWVSSDIEPMSFERLAYVVDKKLEPVREPSQTARLPRGEEEGLAQYFTSSLGISSEPESAEKKTSKIKMVNQNDDLFDDE